jgi:hypothetical protein
MNLADHVDRSALTDADGRYRLRPLPRGEYSVGPSSEPRERNVGDNKERPVPGEFFAKTINLTDGQKTATVDFQAVPHARVVVQFYRSSGEPRSGHAFFVTGETDNGLYAKRVRPDGNGRAEFTVPVGLPDARLQLITNEHSSLRHRISKDRPLRSGRQAKLGTITGDMKDVAIIRYVAPIVIVRAVDQAGNVILDAKLRLQYLSDADDQNISVDEHGDGCWRTRQLLPDQEFKITVQADGYQSESQTLELPEGETREIEVTLTRRS